jgi:hypothetical protein
MAKLHLLPETPDSEPFELIETVVLIGRKPDNTLQVEDNNVSKYHALLVKTDEGYRLYDLHSANGTFVNDDRITTTIIKNNDQLRIGPATFRFESEPAPLPAAVPELRPKIRLASRVAGGHLGQKPGVPAPALSKQTSDQTTFSPAPVKPPATAPVPVPSLVPESKTPPAPAIVPTVVTPAPVAPVAEAAPAKKEEPRVSIRIPESKKSLISQSLTPSDARETQPTTPPVKPPEPERPKPRLGFAPKPPTEPAPAPAPAPEQAVQPAPKPRLGFAPQPPAEPAPAPTPPPEQPAQPAPTTLGGPKPPAGERPLRPKLGGGGGGEMKLKTFKK